MLAMRINGFNINNEHLITELGQALGWGNIVNAPRFEKHERLGENEYCIDVESSLSNEDEMMACIKAAIDGGLKVEFFKVTEG